MSMGPPSGPPPGPPPAGPPPGPPPAGPTGAGSPPWKKWVLPAIGIAVVIVLIAVLASSGGGKKSDTASSGEIFLEPTSDQGSDPFSSSTATNLPSITIPPDTPVTLVPPQTAPTFPKQTGPPKTSGGTVAVNTHSGGTPGLYGGTGDQKVCDKQQLIDFLTGDSAKGAAWAAAQGIQQGQLTSYIDSLTPVLLRGDTRVTNHG